MNNKLALKINSPKPKPVAHFNQHSQNQDLPSRPSVNHSASKSVVDEQHLVKQPTHITVNLHIKDDTKLELQRSVIGITEEDNWADSLQEKILIYTHIPTKIIGITQRKFLINIRLRILMMQTRK